MIFMSYKKFITAVFVRAFMSVMVKELMDKKPVTLSPDINFKDAVRIITKNELRFIPVVNEMKIVVGAVSETDLMKLVQLQPLPTSTAVLTNLPKDIAEKKVSDIINHRPIVISERAEIKDALNLMYATNVTALIVTDIDDKFVGTVRFRNIIEKMLENS
jgi:predicted transcriptional regulator